MAKRKKNWSKIIEETGVRVRLYERPQLLRCLVLDRR